MQRVRQASSALAEVLQQLNEGGKLSENEYLTLCNASQEMYNACTQSEDDEPEEGSRINIAAAHVHRRSERYLSLLMKQAYVDAVKKTGENEAFEQMTLEQLEQHLIREAARSAGKRLNDVALHAERRGCTVETAAMQQITAALGE